MTPELFHAVVWNRRLFDAHAFAARAHEGQLRKYTGEPYIVHPIEVAEIVIMTPGVTESMIMAAFLHDTVEDTGTTVTEIDLAFGPVVAKYVFELTDYFTPENFPMYNRAERKEREALRLMYISPEAKTVKLADGLSNTKSIGEHDPKFLKTYGPEKRAALESLRGGDIGLWNRLDEQLKQLGY